MPTAAEAREAAAAEGLVLVTSTSETGFKGVYRHGDSFVAEARVEGGHVQYLGIFATAEEAALRYARHIGKEAAAAAAAEAAAAAAAAVANPAQSKMTAAEAREAAAAEGLVLVPSTNSSGFKNVSPNGDSFKRVHMRTAIL